MDIVGYFTGVLDKYTAMPNFKPYLGEIKETPQIVPPKDVKSSKTVYVRKPEPQRETGFLPDIPGNSMDKTLSEQDMETTKTGGTEGVKKISRKKIR